MSSEREHYMRWMELEWERRVSTSREEQRTAEVLESLRDVAEESRCPVRAPEYEPEGSRR